MIRKDFAKYIKRGFTLVEVGFVALIGAILIGSGTAIAFAIVDSTKDVSIISETKQIYKTLLNISNDGFDVASMRTSGIKIYDLDLLVTKLNDTLSTNYLVLNKFPDQITTSTIVFNNYDKDTEAYNTFYFFDINLENRCAIANLITGDISSSFFEITYASEENN